MSTRISQELADSTIQTLNTARWTLPYLNDDPSVLRKVQSVATYYPDRTGELIGAMTHIEHRLNHPESIQQGMYRLLMWDSTYACQALLEAILDASEYLDFEAQSSLVGLAVMKVAREGNQPWLTHAKECVRLQVGKHNAWLKENNSPLLSLLVKMEEEHDIAMSKTNPNPSTGMVVIYTRALQLLEEAGTDLEGAVVMACHRWKPTANATHYLPIEALLAAGAPWREALEDPQVEEHKKAVIRQDPIVRRDLLGGFVVPGNARNSARKPSF